MASALVTNWASTRPRNDSCVARRIGGSTSIRRVKNTRNASAASAVSVCVTAKVIEPGAWRRLHRSNSALPRTIPVRNVPSISVNAYVELPSCVESRRVQPIS